MSAEMDVEGRRLSDEDRDRCKSRFESGAYYYGFEGTGVEAIDLILGAVSAAGKAFHHTESWTDKAAFDAGSCVDLIEAAASEAAALLRQQAEEIAAWKDRHHEASTSKAQYVARLNDCEAEVASLTRKLQEAEDMANVGRSLMEQIESNYDSLRGWHPLCDPAEIVVDLINQRDEAERQLQEAVEERDRYRESLERIRLRAAPSDRMARSPLWAGGICIQDLMWCNDEARRALNALNEPREP